MDPNYSDFDCYFKNKATEALTWGNMGTFLRKVVKLYYLKTYFYYLKKK